MKNTKLTPTQIKLKKVLKPIVESILKESNSFDKYGLSIFKKGNLQGIKQNGNVILSAEYSYIDDVINHNGMMMVKDKNGNKKLVDIFSYMDSDDEDDF
jgi:hypothetical protein